jgi:hypothetical protein
MSTGKNRAPGVNTRGGIAKSKSARSRRPTLSSARRAKVMRDIEAEVERELAELEQMHPVNKKGTTVDDINRWIEETDREIANLELDILTDDLNSGLHLHRK